MKSLIKSRDVLASRFFLHKPFLTFIYPRFNHVTSPARRFQSTETTSPTSPPELAMVLSDSNDAQKQGEVSQPPRQKVIVLWDLDNKPPSDLFSPYEAAQNLRAFASRFGNVIKMAAFANKSGMSFVPSSILESRKDLQEYHELEKEMHKKHKVVPDTPYICGVCGAKKKTHADLEKHFKTLHERERNKKLNRASSLKGAKRKRFLANAFPEEKVVRYREAATGVITPADQYKLDSELRRAGVAVNLVKSGSQAADRALMTFAETTWKKKGGSYDWLILLSDDTDFEPMLKDASLKRRVGTIVVGDEKYIGKGKLANAACAWMPWDIVQSGCIDKVAFENAFEYTVPNKQKKERIRQIRDIIGVDEQDGSGASYLSSSSSDENTDNEDILDDNISNQHDLDLASTSVSDSRPFSLPSSSLPSGSSSAEDTLESLASPGSSDLGLSEFPLECEDYWPLSNSYSDPLAALDSLMEGDPFHPNTSYFDFPGKSKSKSKSKSKPKSKQKQKQKQKQKSEPGSKKKEKKKSKEKGTSENK